MTGAVMMIHPSGVGGGGMTVSLSYNSVSGSAYNYGTAVTSAVVAGVVSGGVGPFTYAWAPSTGITASQPTGQSSAFTYAFTAPGAYSGTATVTVTDSLSNTGTATVILFFTCIAAGVKQRC